MNTLFGIPMTTIMVVLVIVLAVVLADFGLYRGAQPRHLPARRAQCTAAQGANGADRHRSDALHAHYGRRLRHGRHDQLFDLGCRLPSLGRVDEVIQAKPDPNSAGSDTGVPEAVLTDLETRFEGDPDIAGFVPTAARTVPLSTRARSRARRSSRSPEWTRSVSLLIGGVVARMATRSMSPRSAANEAYLNADGRGQTESARRRQRQTFYGNAPLTFTVRAIVRDGVLNGSTSGTAFPGLLVPLDRAQAIVNETGVWFDLCGEHRHGAHGSGPLGRRRRETRPVLAAQNLGANKIKQDNVRLAETAGNLFTTFFVVLGLFTIAAGILLIFLIFTMLAAERRGEMGMARAIGMQRRHLVQMFIAEGTAYDLLAAAVGAALGVARARDGGALKRIVGDQFPIVANVQPRSIVIAYCLGVVLTFGTVAFSSFRVSRLNIVAAIRDVDEPPRRHAARRSFSGASLLVAGALRSSVGADGTAAPALQYRRDAVRLRVRLRVALHRRAGARRLHGPRSLPHRLVVRAVQCRTALGQDDGRHRDVLLHATASRVGS